jgi:TonB family protein
VNIEIVRSGGVAFDEKALETVRRWRFRPAIGPNGTPIAVVMPIEVSFHSLN